MYDDKGNITRAGAEQVIRGGGSVSINGKLYQTVESLPDESVFAAGNPKAEADARAKLEKQIADAQAQLQRLGPVGAVAEAKPAHKGAVETEGDGPNAGHQRRAGKS
jgi:hypothetical protein